MAITTPTLGIPSPQAVVTRLEEVLTEAPGAAVAVGLVDIDLFGRYNTEHGTEAGDLLLARLAGVLEEAAGPGRVLRYGGDAYALVLEGVEKEQAFLRLERARAQFTAGAPEAPSISAGVAGAPDDATVAPMLIRKATDALYRAKVSGRNKVCLAREEKMVTKTTHYSQGQLLGLSRLSKRMGVSEAELLREALDDLFRKYNR
jgi:diguanylate cyclase (GGDEF)-like protein